MAKVDYQTYLASQAWAVKREAVKLRCSEICELCNNSAMRSTHHLTYERLGDEYLEDLLGLCDDCHKFLSGKGDCKHLMALTKAYRAIRVANPPVFKPDANRSIRFEDCLKVKPPKKTKSPWMDKWGHVNIPAAHKKEVIAQTLTRTEDQMEVTDELIRCGGSKRAQLELFGITWPPQRGWKRQIVGKVWPMATVREYLSWSKR